MDEQRQQRWHTVNQETAPIQWRELQRFFAAGLALAVDSTLDLVAVAVEISLDNKATVADWVDQGLLGPVSDAQAADWYAQDQQVWAVVIKPWVVVQQRAEE